MKELSVGQKAQRYDEVVSKLRRFMAQGVDPLITRADVQDFFPELTESEDEKIKQRVIKLIKMSNEVGGFALHKWEADEMLAWLEKQGEQKSFARYKVGDTIYYDSFGRLVSFVIANIVEDGTDNPMYEDKDGNSVFQNDIVEKKPVDKVEQKPQRMVSAEAKEAMYSKPAEWSEEDENNINSIVSRLEVDISYWESRSKTRTNEDKKLIDWLKSLRPKTAWKPSDMELEALRLAAEKDGTCLMGLYEQLKKL